MTVEPTRSERRFIGMPDGMYKKKRAGRRVIAWCLADRAGFEPAVGC